MFGCVDPAASKYYSPRCGPSSIGNTSASEMHDSVQAFKPRIRGGDSVGRPYNVLTSACGPKQPHDVMPSQSQTVDEGVTDEARATGDGNS
jgi:hypothetical protein